jgi:hypothetical protein
MVNWPPTPGTYPSWPPPEAPGGLAFSDLIAAQNWSRRYGYTLQNPTVAENNVFFRNARCDDNHQVIGRMWTSADGSRRYPFAVCQNGAHRSLLVLWPPYELGPYSGDET